MDWADYLRDQAAKYRQLAETAEDLSVKEELLDLAAICEEAANNIEDRMSRSGRTFPIVPAARRNERSGSSCAALCCLGGTLA
jgi:hypothetical protein